MLTPEGVCGGSAALAALVACLARSLGLSIPDDLAATGCLELDDGKVVIGSVEQDTIPAKIRALLSNGFRRVFVPGVQLAEFHACVDRESNLKLVGLAEAARAALPQILEILIEGVVEPKPLIQTLLVIDKVCVRDPHGVEQAFPNSVMELLSRSPHPDVQAISLDVLARRATHRGDPAAKEHDRVLESLLATRSIAIADPWLVDYFDSHHLANRAVLALDGGDWNEGGLSRIWKELDEEIVELERRRARRSGRWTSLRDDYALFACRNTRAFQRIFLGRLLGDQGLLLGGLDDRMAMRASWKALVEYGRGLGHDDCSLERQRNYIVDAVVSLAECGAITEAARPAIDELRSNPPTILPLPLDFNGRDECFDAHYRWKWMRLEDDKLWEQDSARWLAAFESNLQRDFAWSYPKHLPVEQIAIHHPDSATRATAARLLDELEWADTYDDSNSILWVIRFRALAAVAVVFGKHDCSGLRRRLDAGLPGPLRDIATRMIERDLLTVMIRCPY